MSHLGDHASALVDDELDHPVRDQALTHLASCEQCQLVVEQVRHVRGRLHTAPDPGPSADLRAALMRVGAESVAHDRDDQDSWRPVSSLPGSWRPFPQRPHRAQRSDRTHGLSRTARVERRRHAGFATAVGCGAASLLAVAFAVLDQPGSDILRAPSTPDDSISVRFNQPAPADGGAGDRGSIVPFADTDLVEADLFDMHPGAVPSYRPLTDLSVLSAWSGQERVTNQMRKMPACPWVWGSATDRFC